MDKKNNKYIAIAYKLYAVADGNNTFIEEATEEKPLVFVSGFGLTLDAFEKAVVDVEKGGEFDFTLTPAEAYGDYVKERVVELDKQMFCIDGKFDSDNIYMDAIVPLLNEDGNHVLGHVTGMSDNTVTMDLNHPLAGKTLNFKGHVVESREATNGEIESILNHLNGGCGGQCSSCGDGCSSCGDGCSSCGGGCGGK